jgi:HD-GYP domain-containing protein (c-di-GMP phosphodiesterase class II)
VCDAFDAMISNRPYSPPKTPAQALAELRRCAGTQFDPTVVEAFVRVLEREMDAAAEAAKVRPLTPATAGASAS